MLKAIIVDDEEAGVESLQILLKKNCPTVQVIATANSVSEAEEKLATASPDVIFLDIAMPFANGFELLKKVKNKNFSVVFTTAYNEYAVKAIKHNALDYLLKPIDSDELVEAVKKCEEKKDSGSPDIKKIEKPDRFSFTRAKGIQNTCTYPGRDCVCRCGLYPSPGGRFKLYSYLPC